MAAATRLRRFISWSARSNSASCRTQAAAHTRSSHKKIPIVCNWMKRYRRGFAWRVLMAELCLRLLGSWGDPVAMHVASHQGMPPAIYKMIVCSGLDVGYFAACRVAVALLALPHDAKSSWTLCFRSMSNLSHVLVQSELIAWNNAVPAGKGYRTCSCCCSLVRPGNALEASSTLFATASIWASTCRHAR